MEIHVQLVSRKSEPWLQAPAAVSVLTRDDIHRSGATSIAEVLRLVPGMQVARISSSLWAVSARGYNGRFANKLLVQIDGRTVYTPLFSGVYWEVQDLVLEDVERIEVIRGPGATLWGANAVNGIINVVTRSAGDTQGLMVTGGAGTEERAFSAVRYGGRLDAHTHYRVFAKGLLRDSFADSRGASAADGWSLRQTGFRLDREAPGSNSLMVQGHVLKGRIDQLFKVASLEAPHQRIVPDTIEVLDTHILGGWTHRWSDMADFSVLAYYQRSRRSELIFSEVRHTADLDLQHRFAVGTRHEVVWGGGYRFTRDRLDGTFAVNFVPDRRTLQLLNLFVQDDIELIPRELSLIFGSKFEYNSYTGLEIQPTARLSWMLNDGQAVWMAVSRAVRTPSRGERDGNITIALKLDEFPSEIPVFTTLTRNRAVDTERLVTLEGGYRVRVAGRFSLDIAAFYNSYRGILNGELLEPVVESDPRRLIFPSIIENTRSPSYLGVEAAIEWHITPAWHVRVAHGFSQRAPTIFTEVVSRNNHQTALHSQLDLAAHWQLDGTLRHTSRHRNTAFETLGEMTVDAYTMLDIMLRWQPLERLEVSVAGQNLLDRRHAEFSPLNVNAKEGRVERGAYAALTWNY